MRSRAGSWQCGSSQTFSSTDLFARNSVLVAALRISVALVGQNSAASCWNFSTTVAHGRAWPLNHKQPAVVECVQQFVGGDTTDSGCHGLLVETASRLPRGADGAALAGLTATMARMEVRGP